LRGRAKIRATMARVDTIHVYRRDGISFPLATGDPDAIVALFTGRLQGIHTSASQGRNSRARVVTR
jgi:hypothetical protein